VQSSDGPVILRVKGIKKSYYKGKHEIPVLRGVDMQVVEGKLTAVVGQSGCGKSTLLHLLATLDQPDEGEVHFDGRRIDNLPSRQRDALRNQDIGIIFQFYHLLPELSALENVLMPVLINQGILSYWRTRSRAKQRARELLAMVGLEDRSRHRPSELSGGEMQRAAIARALMAKPKLLLADEPTGNLDRKNGDDVLAILRRLNEQDDLTIVMVTHDQTLASAADRIVHLVEGRVLDSLPGGR
jgi:lipoprotein-releasing system ATP-binding protein